MADGDDHMEFPLPERKVIDFPMRPEIAARLTAAEGPDSIAPARTERATRYQSPCHHPQIKVVEEARHLECRDCGAIVDPIQWVRWLAGNWDVYANRWLMAKRQVDAIETKLEQLKKEERNLKARLRNAEAPEVKDARKLMGEAVEALRAAERVVAFDPTLQQRLGRTWMALYRAAEKLKPANRAKAS